MATKGRSTRAASPKPDPQEVLLGEKGRLVLPVAFRRALGLRKGERIVILIDADGRLRLKTPAEVAADVRGMRKHLAPLTDDE